MTFLGFLIDGKNHLVMIPMEKVAKVNIMIEELLSKKKTTVLRLQQICGFLNFLCRCVVPGRVFTRRLYNFIPSNLKPHHHVKVNQEIKLDMFMWKKFLAHPAVFSRQFMDFSKESSAEDLDLYTDSSRNFSLGCGGVFNNQWFFIGWDLFTAKVEPSIEYLELYAVAVAVKIWAPKLKNMKIFLFCDNEVAVHMINSSSSRCKNCMVLLCIITLQGLIHNVKISAKHVASKRNSRADTISRRKFELFRRLSPFADLHPQEIPMELWPLSKIWIPNN